MSEGFGGRILQPTPLPGREANSCPDSRSPDQAQWPRGRCVCRAICGRRGAALSLLYGEFVRSVVINDADSRVYAFWDAVLNRTAALVELIRETPLTVKEWKRHAPVLRQACATPRLRVGFAAFYLNRCNRSGIIGNAGLIGGQKQTGKWNIDARFNREDLVARVQRVARYRDRIESVQPRRHRSSAERTA